MKLNFVAQRRLRTEPGEPGPRVIKTQKAYDLKTKAFSYHQQVIQHHQQTGGASTEGDWYDIDERSYDLEGAEIKWDNHP